MPKLRRKAYSPKRPKNPSEASFFDLAQGAGWGLMTRGWPDYFCWKEDGIFLVEIKRKHGYRLKYFQNFLLQKLASYGVPCYLWNPQTGFLKLEPDYLKKPEPPVENFNPSSPF